MEKHLQKRMKFDMDSRSYYPEITLLHALGAMMIFVAHCLQKMGNSSISEILLSGVPLFLIVSGFLVSRKAVGGVKKDRSWLLKRMVRILIPYYIVLVTTLILYWLFHVCDVGVREIAFLLTAMQGVQNYLLFGRGLYGAPIGVGHFWFVTIILLCYYSVFFSSRSGLWDCIKKSQTVSVCMLLVMLFIIDPLLLAVGIQLNYVLIFFVGIVLGKFADRQIGIMMLPALILAVIMGISRIALRKYVDGTVLYDRYIVSLSTDSIALLLFVSVFFIRKEFPKLIDWITSNKCVLSFSTISYEFYLIHYILLDLMVKFAVAEELAAIARFGLVFLLTVILSVIVSKAASVIKRKLLTSKC